MKTWSLDFINDREFLQNLEQHSLTDLCSALHGLLYEFTPDMYVYCIIDSISCFDISRLLKDLGTVMEGPPIRKQTSDQGHAALQGGSFPVNQLEQKQSGAGKYFEPGSRRALAQGTFASTGEDAVSSRLSQSSAACRIIKDEKRWSNLCCEGYIL